MKTLKTFLGLVIFGLIVYFVLTLIMPKIAFSQKKAVIDSYKISQTKTDNDDTYIVRLDMNKGNWETLELELVRIGFKCEEPAKYWKDAPDTDLFTAAEIKSIVKEYYRITDKGVPISRRYFDEYFAVMQDESGVHLYFEAKMRDSEFEPLQ